MDEVVVLEKHKTITRVGGAQEKFLIYDNNRTNRILLFCSVNGLNILSKAKKWHGDGTFYTAAQFMPTFTPGLMIRVKPILHGYF